jgi:hypothetical protein
VKKPKLNLKQRKILLGFVSLILSLFCLAAGYVFYRTNQKDWFNAIFFSIGLLGIILSVVRNASIDDPPS